MNLKSYLLISFVFLTNVISAQSGNGRVISLDSVFVLMERNSTQLKMSDAIVENTKQAMSVVENDRLPSISVGLSALYLGDATVYDRNLSNSQNSPMPHSGNSFSLEASYLVFAGGAVSNSIDKAGLEVQVAHLAHVKKISEMRFLVAGYYLDLFKLRNQRKVFLKNIEQTEVLIEHVSARKTEGMALANDITRYELMMQNLRLSLIEIENSISIINKHLVITLGLSSETIILPDTTFLNLKLESKQVTQDELMLIAQENRPELRSTDLDISIAKKDVRIAKAGYYPSFAIIASDNFNGPITVEIPTINKNLNYWYVGVGVKYDLASLYKSKKNVRLAKGGQTVAQYARNVELENTQTSVHNAYTNFIESFDKLRVYEKTFQLATENYSIINNRYLNGLVLITEMLDASNMKLNAELQVVNANLDIIYNHYKLLREIGKL